MLLILLFCNGEIIKILPFCDEECQKNAIFGYSQNINYPNNGGNAGVSSFKIDNNHNPVPMGTNANGFNLMKSDKNSIGSLNYNKQAVQNQLLGPDQISLSNSGNQIINKSIPLDKKKIVDVSPSTNNGGKGIMIRPSVPVIGNISPTTKISPVQGELSSFTPGVKGQSIISPIISNPTTLKADSVGKSKNTNVINDVIGNKNDGKSGNMNKISNISPITTSNNTSVAKVAPETSTTVSFSPVVNSPTATLSQSNAKTANTSNLNNQSPIINTPSVTNSMKNASSMNIGYSTKNSNKPAIKSSIPYQMSMDASITPIKPQTSSFTPINVTPPKSVISENPIGNNKNIRNSSSSSTSNLKPNKPEVIQSSPKESVEKKTNPQKSNFRVPEATERTMLPLPLKNSNNRIKKKSSNKYLKRPEGKYLKKTRSKIKKNSKKIKTPLTPSLIISDTNSTNEINSGNTQTSKVRASEDSGSSNHDKVNSADDPANNRKYLRPIKLSKTAKKRFKKIMKTNPQQNAILDTLTGYPRYPPVYIFHNTPYSKEPIEDIEPSSSKSNLIAHPRYYQKTPIQLPAFPQVFMPKESSFPYFTYQNLSPSKTIQQFSNANKQKSASKSSKEKSQQVKNNSNKSEESTDENLSSTTSSSFSFSEESTDSEEDIIGPKNDNIIRTPHDNEPPNINDYIYKGMYKDRPLERMPTRIPMQIPKNLMRVLARDFLLDKIFPKSGNKKSLRIDKNGPEPLSESFFVPSRKKDNKRLRVLDLDSVINDLIKKNQEDKAALQNALEPKEDTRIVYLSDVLSS